MSSHADEFFVYTSETVRGTYVAATNRSPYFCIEAKTEDEALRVASEAIQFWRANRHVPSPVKPVEIRTATFNTRRRISSSDLMPTAA